MPIAERLGLLHKGEALGVRARRGFVSLLIARRNHDGNLIDAGLQHFLNDDAQRRLRRAIVSHKRLQWQRPLIFSGGGYDRLLDFHNAAASVTKRIRGVKLYSPRAKCVRYCNE